MTAELVEQLLELGKPDRARAALRPLLAAEPESVPLLHLQVRVELTDENWAAALAAAQRYAAAAPHSGLPHAYRAMALVELGEPDDAVIAARTGVARDPERAWLHYQLARAADQHPLGAHEARAAAEQAVRLDPEDADYHFFLGLVARSKFNDLATARSAYEHTLRLQPDHANAMNNLAVLDLGSGRRRSAVRGFTDAALLAPDDTLIGGNIVRTLRIGLLHRRWWVLGITLASVITFTVLAPAGATPWIPALAVLAAVAVFWPVLLGVLVAGYPEHLRRTVRRALYRDPACLPALIGMVTTTLACPVLVLCLGTLHISALFLPVAIWFAVWMGIAARRAGR